MEQLKTSCSPWTFGAIGYTLDGCPLIFGTFWWPTSAKNSKKTSNSRFVLLIIDWKCLTHCYYENPILFWLCSLKDSSFFLKLFLACVCYLKFKKMLIHIYEIITIWGQTTFITPSVVLRTKDSTNKINWNIFRSKVVGFVCKHVSHICWQSIMTHEVRSHFCI